MSDDREQQRRDFLKAAGLADAVRAPLPGDASTRRYERLTTPGGASLMLMDQAASAESPPADPSWTPEQRRATILARNNTTEAELVAGCMKNSPKWGRSECEFWAPSKRRHHPGTVQNVPSSLPPVGELFSKITAPTLILKADAQGDLRKQNEEVASRLPRGKIVHIEGAGHNVRRENKARTIEVMKAFLSGT